MNRNCNIYLDIDGVLLKKDGQIPNFADEFISYITKNFNCYWLTTHCRGDENKAIQYLSKYYSAIMIEKLKAIQPTFWNDLKTEAIEFESDFFWIDDSSFEAEKRILTKSGKSVCLLTVDLNNSKELKEIIEQLGKYLMQTF